MCLGLSLRSKGQPSPVSQWLRVLSGSTLCLPLSAALCTGQVDSIALKNPLDRELQVFQLEAIEYSAKMPRCQDDLGGVPIVY